MIARLIKKSDYLPKISSLILVEANQQANPQVEAIRMMLLANEPKFVKKVGVMGAYLGENLTTFVLRMSVFG